MRDKELRSLNILSLYSLGTRIPFSLFLPQARDEFAPPSWGVCCGGSQQGQGTLALMPALRAIQPTGKTSRTRSIKAATSRISAALIGAAVSSRTD